MFNVLGMTDNTVFSSKEEIYFDKDRSKSEEQPCINDIFTRN